MNAPRTYYPYFTQLQLRWSDFDLFHHVNNVQCYRLFEHLYVTFYRDLGINLAKSPIIPFAAETHCYFRKPIDHGEAEDFGALIDGGLCITYLGNSSLRLHLALFHPGEDEASVESEWTHVFVDRETQRPAPITGEQRSRFLTYTRPSSG